MTDLPMNKSRRSFLRSALSASIAITMGARASMERLIGESEKVALKATRKVAVLNPAYATAPYEEKTLFHPDTLTVMARRGVHQDFSEFPDVAFPRRFQTLKDAAKGENQVYPYIIVEENEAWALNKNLLPTECADEY